MRQGREIVLCALAVLAGNVTGDLLSFHPIVYLILSLVFAVVSCCSLSSRLSAGRPGRLHPGWPLAPLLALAMLGAAAVQIGRMPPVSGPSSLAVWASGCKASFSRWLGRLLPAGDELSVLQALSIGDKSGLDRDLRAAYRESGAMHLLALSGLHVGLVYALLDWLLRPLGGGRPVRLLRSLSILGFLWIYAVITGLSASISRAVLMITFYEVSGLLSGDRDALSALAGSALLLMLFRPESPRDIGFQLSYTAVLSILLLHSRLSGLLQTRSRLLRRVWELLCVSLCCQSTCGVLAWIYFGSFPRYFLLTTLLAIPLTTLILYTAAATFAVAGLSALVAQLLGSGPSVTGDALPSVSHPLLSLLGALSQASAEALGWLLHLLNTLIRLIASL